MEMVWNSSTCVITTLPDASCESRRNLFAVYELAAIWRGEKGCQPLLNYVTPGSKSYNGICIFYTSYLIRIIKILTLDESLNKLFGTLSGTYVKECKLR